MSMHNQILARNKAICGLFRVAVIYGNIKYPYYVNNIIDPLVHTIKLIR